MADLAIRRLFQISSTPYQIGILRLRGPHRHHFGQHNPDQYSHAGHPAPEARHDRAAHACGPVSGNRR
ncbi:hypothetical protein [Gluconacetobacter liquefaciens]|uniref:hypothetical protein n=1 Tax=Gluconacetobacter liquefaciens TaxID=89584 RepID=UPI001FE669D8|nr:hypothetical protein [Gluconacetobacter liquefaciens]